MRSIPKSPVVLAALILVAGALSGASSCKGEKGDTGPAAPAAIPPTSTALLPGQDLPGIVIDILSVTGGSFGRNPRAGDTLSVTFTLRKRDGLALGASELDFSQAFVSGPSINYQRVIAPQADWHKSAIRNADGSWTYTFPVAIPSVYQAPDNYTGTLVPGGEELVGQPLVDGTYTVGMEAFKNYTEGITSFTDPGNATKDFLLGGASEIKHRELVRAENCNQCHVTLQAHGGFRRDPNLCVLCHVAGAEDRNLPTVEGGTPNVTIDFRVLIHKIHNGKHLPSVHGVTTDGLGDRVYNTDSISGTVATGNGAATSFVFALPALMTQELRAGGFSMTFTNPGPDTRTVTDDGAGKLIGAVAAGTNTVDYRTGAVNVTFNVAPASGVPVVATVTFGAKGSYKVVGYMDSVSDFSKVAFPVWPSSLSAMPRDLGYSALTPVQKEANDDIRSGVVACEKCHGVPTNGGTAPARGSLAYEQPSRRACGSCHDDVVWTNPYAKNGLPAMPAQADDSTCNVSTCHPTSGSSIAVRDAHIHPMENPTFYDVGTPTDVNFAITGLTGGTGPNGNFQVGDAPAVEFTLKDGGGTDFAMGNLDAATVALLGPTTNRQVILPYSGPSSITFSPFDFSGRLAAASPSGKGSMGKAAVTGALQSETLTVQFSSATAYTVVGSTSGPLGDSGTVPNLPLAASPSTNPSGSSLSAVVVSPTAVPQQILVAFSSATDFTVTGSVSGALGTGTEALPASTNASVRFTSSEISFTLSVGTTAFSAGKNIYLVVFRGGAANPVAFAIVAGRTSFASGDRFYYDIEKPAATYTRSVPMEFVLEYVGDVGALANAANVPVHYGRQTLYEVTTVTAGSSLAADAPRFARFVDVQDAASFVKGEYVVVEGSAAIGTREYLRINSIVGLRLWFYTSLRYAHSTGAAVDHATLTYRQEGVDYALTPATGAIAPGGVFTAGDAVVMSYRTDGRFGYRRHSGDTIQTAYQPAVNDEAAFGQDWGKWTGLSYLDGTYTASIWGARIFSLGLNGEQQQYRLATPSSNVDFLFGGSAAEIVPHSLVAPATTCDDCHTVVQFHSSGRRGLETCVTCHSVAGAMFGPGTTMDFRTMLHAVHKGRDLANASTYFGGLWSDVVFPAMPGRTKHCAKCHGTSASWEQPADRTHPAQTVPLRRWRAVCGSCHDTADAWAHMALNTSGGGLESCEACHGTGSAQNVPLVHKNR